MIEQGGFWDRSLIRLGMALRLAFYAIAIFFFVDRIDFNIGDRRLVELTVGQLGTQLGAILGIAALGYKFLNPNHNSGNDSELRAEHWRFWGQFGFLIIAGLIAFIVYATR
jgi:hypothetical protein